ncbi:MAG: proprotein convertase P-domain-containing protein [Bacteroidota bacterium]
MPDGFTGSFFIQVQNATNPTLGQNGQGVCGVRLHFDHEYLGDLKITLTSPSGQMVTLVGPIGLFGPTDFTTWDVLFLPCGDAVTPDPGFSNTWNNNQPWGLFGNYTGSYYPNSGCLENFNSGPVNGLWTLTVTDGQAIDVGNFYNYEIIFCDPSGINCFSCAADAGNLTQPDVSACQGSSSLTLSLPPTYVPPIVAPPVPDYAYTYVISGPGGIIMEYQPAPDLSTFPPGNYTVCGLSYLATQEGLIPPPNGALTVNQLTTQLNSTQPPFCGDVSINCVGVQVKALPPDEEEFVTICAPQCYDFHNSTYCASGDYVKNLTLNGCPYIATLHLTVHQPNTIFANETICSGGCSSNPAFPNACAAGGYQATLQNIYGCDSTIILNVTVMNVSSVIIPPPPFNCGQSTATINGTGSTTGAGVNYLWTASNGGTILGSPQSLITSIGSPGDYQLRVCRSLGGATCCDSASVSISSNLTPPGNPSGINGNPTICQGQSQSFSVAAIPGATSYTWTVPPGVTINSGQNTTVINVTWNSPTGGDICVTANNTCGVSQPSCLTISVKNLVVPTLPTGNTAVCAGSTQTYSIPALPAGTTYTWTVTAPATIVSGQGTNQISVKWGTMTSGSVCISATSTCGTSAPVCLPVTISDVPAPPAISGNLTACSGNPETYTITAIPGASSYNWQITGGVISSGNGTNSVQVVWDNNVSSGTLCATAQNTCGASTQTCINITVQAPLALPVIAGDATLCTGTTGSYSITPISSATGYNWTVPAGGTIVSGQNTTAIAVNWAAAPGGNVCVSAISGCGAGPQQCFPVVIHTQPLANAGADGALCGTSYTLGAIPSVPGATGVWSTLSGPGSVSFANASSDTTNATATQNGLYLFLWTENNGGCMDGDTVQVNFNGSPNAGQIMPDCDANDQNYTIAFQINGGTPPYTIPGGTVTGNNFLSAPVVSGQTYSFMITDANGCVSQAITGGFNCNCSTNAGQMNLQQLSTCEGGSVTAQHQGGQNLDGNDVAAFVMHSNSGPSLGTIFAENTTGIFSFQPGMVYGTTYYISYVVGNNLNGLPDLTDLCLSVAQGQPVVFYQNPIANAGIDQAACGQTMTVTGNTGVGAWTVAGTPAGGTINITSPQSAVTDLNATAFGNYTLTWTLDNNGCTGSDDIVVTFNELPAAGAIAEVCDGANEHYTVSFPISGGLAPYTVNSVAVAGNNYVSAPLANSQSYSFTIMDANGCASAAVTGIYNCNCATDAGQMNLTPLSACDGQSVTAQFQGGENLDANDTVSFVLHTGSGTNLGIVVDQNKTGVFSFQTGMTYGQTYYISLVAGNNIAGFPDPADPCFSVAQGQPVVFYQNPIANAGVDNTVCGNTLNLNGSGSGTWTLSAAPPGGSLSFADAQNSSTAVSATAPGTYTATWTVSVNNCTSTDQVDLQFNDVPILADLTRDCDAANENFTVNLTISGGTAPYSVNSTMIAGSTFSSQPLPNGSGYIFNISDANGCTMPQIDGAYSCNCSTNAGSLQTQTLSACEGATVTAQFNNDQHLDGNDVIAYVLHSASGPALGQVFAQNNTGTFGIQPGMTAGQTYYISVVAGNSQNGIPNPMDPCFSVAPGQPVVFLANPNPQAGANTSTCGQTIDLQATNSGFNGAWAQVAGPGVATFTTPGAANSAVSVAGYGTYLFEWKETNSICVKTDTVAVAFNEIPSVNGLDEICNPTNTQYNVTFMASGGATPYTVNGLGGTFTGNTFNSLPVANTTSYSCTLIDANGCKTDISGSHNCNCFTDAGDMQTTPAVFCADMPATAVWNNNGHLDGDDIFEYVLHSQSGSNVGTVYAVNSQPSFNFGAGLQTGVTYYISAVAGNNNGGLVDLNDPCLSVAPGAPVVWKPVPTAGFTGDATICAGTTTNLTFSGTGVYPLTLSYTDGTSNLSATLANQQPILVSVSPTSTTTYTLSKVTDGTNPTCSATPGISVQIAVNQPVSAGTAKAPLELCVGVTQTIQLTSLITGADAGGLWQEVSTIPSIPGAFNANAGTFNTAGQAAGTYKFRYRIQAQAPCETKEATVSVVLNPTPVADAGADKTLNCNISSAALGGPGTSAGMQYIWKRDTTLVANSAQLNTGNPGKYTLLVTTPAGCTASDQATVVLDAELPFAKTITSKSVRCFGDKNGSITIDSVVSSHLPVVFSLDGGPFTNQNVFFPLTPGKYTVTLQDANGCEWVSDSITVGQPAKLTVELGGNLVVTLGDQAKIEAAISLPLSAIDTIFWVPLLDTLHAGTPQQTFRPLQSGQIGVRVVDTNGCAVNDRVTWFIDQMHQVYIPNIIKPASDLNNLLMVFGGADVSSVESLQIYDRWGSKVFESLNFLANDPTIGWDGKFKGAEVNPGVYIYYAVVRFINGERVLFKGDVTVFR